MIDNFKIRTYDKGIGTWLKGKPAVIEHLRQQLKVIKHELWWDYDFGIDLRDLKNSFIYYLQDILNNNQYIINYNIIKYEFIKNTLYVTVELFFEDDTTNFNFDFELNIN